MADINLTNVLFLLFCLIINVSAQTTSTTIVSVTSTTTVHVTATDYQGACDNFVGACVVYGTYSGAPYTTTAYVYAPTSTPSTTYLETSTRTFVATTTAPNSAACSGFSGACVVYATDGSAAASSSGYQGGGGNGHGGVGNGQGYIGPNTDGGEGVIGNAATHERWRWEFLVGLGGVVTILIACI